MSLGGILAELISTIPTAELAAIGPNGMEMIKNFVKDVVPSALPSSGPASDVLQYYGQFGDYVGGYWGTIIGVVSSLLVLATLIYTIQTNRKSKTYQVFAEMLRSHEEIIGSIRLGEEVGRDAFNRMLSEFYFAYDVVKDIDERSGGALLLVERIDIAFLVMYYGTHPEAAEELYRTYPMFDAHAVLSRVERAKRSRLKTRFEMQLGERVNGTNHQKNVWKSNVAGAVVTVGRSAMTGVEKTSVITVLHAAKQCPGMGVDSDEIVDMACNIAAASEFGGHQNRLSNYFRNLFSAFVFLDRSAISSKEKYELARVLRSKLSNYEQALLALNCLTRQGSAWMGARILDRYEPIKNVPRTFFSFDPEFDLAAQFPEVTFEWQKRHRVGSDGRFSELV